MEEHNKNTQTERQKRQDYAKDLQKMFEDTSKALEEASKNVIRQTQEKEWFDLNPLIS